LLHKQSRLEHGGLRGVRDEGSLESALARPQQILNYREDATLAELRGGSVCLNRFPWLLSGDPV
jgi:prophage maintenance system killer protein